MAASSSHGYASPRPNAATTLVAPSTSTPVWSLPTPSICTKNSFSTWRWPPLLLPPYASGEEENATSRDPHSESISSMKITVGFFSRAMMNICFTRLGITSNHYPHRALSPCHLLTRSDDDTDMNVLSACEATAFAKYDLPSRQHNHQHVPVPGGPYIRMPFQGCLFPTKNSGWMVGRITAPISSSFATAKPATSSHLMFGFSVTMAWASWLFSLSSSSLPPPPSAFAGFFTSKNQ